MKASYVSEYPDEVYSGRPILPSGTHAVVQVLWGLRFFIQVNKSATTA